MRSLATALLICGAIGVAASCHDGAVVTGPRAKDVAVGAPLGAVADVTPGWPYQPAGLQPVSERAFSALSESGWHDGASANFSIVQDSTAPRSPSGVGEARLPAGFASGNTPMTNYVNLAGQAPAIYTSFWLKLSSNFQGVQNKVLWFTIGDRNRATFSAVASTNGGTLRPIMELRDVVRAPGLVLSPNVNAAAEVKRGEWQRWEILIRANSAANADGSVEVWVDGTKATMYTGIQFVTDAQGHSWQGIAWAPYWGGSGATVPTSQYMRMDHMYVGAGTPAAVAAVASVGVTAPSASLVVGDSEQLSASAFDANGNVIAGSPMTWTSSDSTIVSVASSGLATGRRAGTARITAASGGQAGSVALSVAAAPVTVPVASVSVTSPVQSLYPSQTAQLSAVARDSAGNTLTGRTVSWSSSAPAVANVSSTGLVTAVATGSVTITATSEGRSGSATLSVVQVPVAAVRVTPGSSGLSVGQGVQLVAVAVDSAGNTLTGRSIIWSSSSDAIATVSSAGYVTAAGSGTATISATSGTISGHATITVTQPVASVVISAPATSIAVGSTVQLTATTRDASGTVLTGRAVAWTSNTPSVATVSSNGVVSGVGAGTATITAASEGRSASVTITVTAPAPPSGSNEPSGLTAISDRHFLAFNEAGWTDYKPANFSLVSDATAPQYSGTVGQVLYPAGFSGGAEPVNLYVQLGNKNTVYLAFWFKMSPNFYGHPNSSVNKIFHIWIGGANRVYLAAMGSGNTATFQPQVRLQQVPTQADYNLSPNVVPGATIVRDRWYKWEVVLHANTPGQSDGSVEMWLDGVKIASYPTVQFVAAGQSNTWETLNWAPTWGGVGATVPADQWMRMSRIYLSGR